MKKIKEFNEEYKKQLQNIPLPSNLKEFLKIESCLKASGNSGTVLVRESILNRQVIMKWAVGPCAKFLEMEYRILMKMQSEGFTGIPCPYRLVEEQDTVYLIREYIPGESLYERIENSAPLTESEIRSLGKQLCHMLRQFQSMNPPLIHRDIKPENLVQGNDGQLYLIDFGSARYYQPGGRKDTFLIGSPDTAAPEQYGITQTDFRTDMYAVGKTLCYAATVSYEREFLEKAPVNRRLKRIILKAMEFDPDKRYKSVEELEKALNSECFLEKTQRKRVGANAAGALLLLALGLGTGMALEKGAEDVGVMTEDVGLNTVEKVSDTKEESADENQVVVFREKLIEQAVRQQLGLDETTPITEKMLLDITSLSIVENQILTEEDNVNNRSGETATANRLFAPEEHGEIRELTDLVHMKHLLKLTLCNQHITDLTPLQNLPLEQLYLPNNDITDISVVKTMFNLTKFSICGNPVQNMEELKECSGLTFLNISNCSLKSLDFLKEMNVSELSVMDTQVEEGFEILKELDGIIVMDVGNLDEELTEILRNMENLDTILCWGEYLLPDLTPLAGMQKLVAIGAGNGFTSLEGIEKIPVLEQLYLDRSDVHDLSPISGAKNLKTISIVDTTVFDLNPILEHPGLERVICTEEQKQKILELNPTPRFTIGW